VADRRLVLGPPGCGKTARLTAVMQAHLRAGVPADRIAFVSFTKAAVGVARERASALPDVSPDDLRWFRTVHSATFRQLGLRRSDVFGREDLARLAEVTGEELTGHTEIDAPTIGERGDALLFLDQTARASGRTLEDAWRSHGAPVDWHRLIRFRDAYLAYRRDTGKLDFTDMLEAYVGAGDAPLTAGLDGAPVPVDVALIDEAQDLTPLQWKVVGRMFSGASEVWVAGDDDQSIYSWAGADTEALLNFRGEREVLGLSHRLPRAVHAVAAGVAAGISRRNRKDFAPRDAAGAVDWVRRPDEIDLSGGTWLLLARTRRQLGELSALARGQGVTYSVMGVSAVDQRHVRLILDWEALRRGAQVDRAAAVRLAAASALRAPSPGEADAFSAADLGVTGEMPIWHDGLIGIPLDDREYLLSCLRRGERLGREPRVRVSTIHGAKGAEAERVLLVTDLTRRVERGIELDPDAEQRVLYVGVTRASEELHVVAPRGPLAYRL
jgi:superfamily I DNA/RNA helicase